MERCGSDCEKTVIIHVLTRTKGNQSAAARLLGTTKRILTTRFINTGLTVNNSDDGLNEKGELNIMKKIYEKNNYSGFAFIDYRIAGNYHGRKNRNRPRRNRTLSNKSKRKIK